MHEKNVFNDIEKLWSVLQRTVQLKINPVFAVDDLAAESRLTRKGIKENNARFLLNGAPLSYDVLRTLDSEKVVYCFFAEKNNEKTLAYVGETQGTFWERHQYTLTGTMGKNIDTDYRLLLSILTFLKNRFTVHVGYFVPMVRFHGVEVSIHQDIERELIKGHDPIVNYHLKRYNSMLKTKRTGENGKELKELYTSVCSKLFSLQKNGHEHPLISDDLGLNTMNNNAHLIQYILSDSISPVEG